MLASAIINKLDTQLSPFDLVIIGYGRGRHLLKRYLIACRDFHYQGHVTLIKHVLILLIAACMGVYRLISLCSVYTRNNVGVKLTRVKVQRQG